MLAIVPITLNSSNIVSDAPTSMDPAEWDTSLSYAIGDRVKVTVGNVNKIYECIIAATNTDASPEADILKITPKWFEVGSINKYAMFDSIKDSFTVTTTATSITITATLSMTVNSLAIFGTTNVDNVTVNAYTSFPTGNVYSKTISLTNGYSLNTDIPNTNNLTIVFVFSGTAPLSIGNLSLGTYTLIGLTQIGAQANIINFSLVERDVNGNAHLVVRRSVPKTDQKVFIDKSKVSQIVAFKEANDSIPIVWSGFDDEVTNPYFKALLVLGIYREFSFELDNPVGPMINLEIEEV